MSCNFRGGYLQYPPYAEILTRPYTKLIITINSLSILVILPDLNDTSSNFYIYLTNSYIYKNSPHLCKYLKVIGPYSKLLTAHLAHL